MRSSDMTVLRWSEPAQAWRLVEGEAPEGLGGAEVGLYETLMTGASAYALALHADRIRHLSLHQSPVRYCESVQSPCVPAPVDRAVALTRPPNCAVTAADNPAPPARASRR